MKIKEEVKAAPVAAKPVVPKTEMEVLRETLIYLRDNVVSGNENHINAINGALNYVLKS